MAAYTATARAAAGSAAAIESFIQLAAIETNKSYQNSGIAQRIRVVHMVEVAYTESGDSTKDVDRLRDTSDGHMDDVHALRTTYGADIVVLIVNTLGNDTCGEAVDVLDPVSDGFKTKAFAVVKRSCAVGNRSFAHELGHLMGARHDWYVDDSDGDPYSYNHGYANPSGEWRTIMAYSDLCDQLKVACTRGLNWSNPGIAQPNKDGTPVPMGVKAGTNTDCDEGDEDNPPCDANNAATLNNTASTVAGWYPPGNLPPANDNFANAHGIDLGTAPYILGQSTLGATTELDDPNVSCGSAANRKQSASVWFRVTPSRTDRYRLTTAGSDYDTVINIYTGNTLASLSPLSGGCDDNSGGGTQSQVTVSLTAGVTYVVEVTHKGGGLGGALDLTISTEPPDNDEVTGRKTVSSLPYTDVMDTIVATRADYDPVFWCGSGESQQEGQSVWYMFTPAANGWYTFSTKDSDYDTVLMVMPDLYAPASATFCDDEGAGGGNATITAELFTGRPYYIVVADYSGTGGGKLHLSVVEAPNATPTPTRTPTPTPMICYSLTTSVSGLGQVNVSGPASNRCPSGKFPAGANLSLRAEASSAAYAFAGWSGDASGSDNPITVTMDRDKSVTASFGDTCIIVQAVASPAQAGSPSVRLMNSTEQYNCLGKGYLVNTWVTVRAGANAGWRLDHWSADGVPLGHAKSQFDTTATSNITYTAHFTQDVVCYSLSIELDPSEGGAVNVESSTSAACASGGYPYNAQVSLRATAYSGYTFDHWEGDRGLETTVGGATSTLGKIVMDQDREVIAVFRHCLPGEAGCPVPPTTPAPSASISGPNANPGTITSGQCSTLSWSAQNVTDVYLYGGELGGEPGIGVAGQGSRQVCPTTSTTYTLRANTQASGYVYRTVTVQVNAPANRNPNMPSNVSPATNTGFDSGAIPRLCGQHNGDPDGDAITGYYFLVSGAGSWESGWVSTNCVDVPSGVVRSAGTYYWLVRVQDARSGVTASSTWYFVIRAPTPPATPAGFSASVCCGNAQDYWQVNLQWNASSGATYYEVWRRLSNQSQLTYFTQTSATSWGAGGSLHSSLFPATFGVRACNAAGCSSLVTRDIIVPR